MEQIEVLHVPRPYSRATRALGLAMPDYTRPRPFRERAGDAIHPVLWLVKGLVNETNPGVTPG